MQMELDMTKLMILLQRKYSSIREIDRLTKELEDAFARNDDVSAAMLLEMRAEEMAKVDNCVGEIWQQGESDRRALQKLKVLMTSDPARAAGESPEEEKIYEIRRKFRELLKEVQEKDRILNRRVGGDKSFYAKTDR